MNLKDKISPVVSQIKPSGIRKFFDIASEMKDSISLGIGEPDFVTPWHIRDAGIYSLEKGQTYYTSNAGLVELREEICLYMKRKFNLHYHAASEVLVTVGGSEAIDLCLRTLVSNGDEVLIPEPSFVCYKPCTILSGGIPVPIITKAEDDFKLTAKQLKESITEKTKVLILPYPNNPTGAVLEKEDVESIAEVLKGTDIMVLSDEIYAELTYGSKHFSIANIPSMKERTVIVSGFSKCYAMTGWRLGYALAHSDIIAPMTKIHQFAIMSAPTNSQYAAVAALRDGDEDILYMCGEYDGRRKLLINRLNKMGLDCFNAKGAFYAFPSVKKTGMSSEEFCEKLLMEQKVAVIPGTAFGDSGEGFIRISYAYSIEQIDKALDRIGLFINNLK